MLLKTAVATVISMQQKLKPIFFDECSQRSLLSQELADILLLKPPHKENIHVSLFGSKIPLNKRMDAA